MSASALDMQAYKRELKILFEYLYQHGYLLEVPTESSAHPELSM